MPTEFVKFIRQIMSDADGVYSSKRLITFIAFLLLCLAFVSNLYWGFVIKEFMYESMMYIVISGFGFATLGERVTDLWRSKTGRSK